MSVHGWHPVLMYELHYADQQHHACEAVQVPVPVHGCLPLGYVRHYFPGARSLHYIYQGNLVSVSHSIPYTSGMFDTSRVVFHLPKDFAVLTVFVSCVDMLDNNIKTDCLRFDGITRFIERLNSKLISKNMLVDCACLVLDDLWKLFKMLEKDTGNVHQLLINFSQENWDAEIIKSESEDDVKFSNSLKSNYTQDGIKLILERINSELRWKNIILDCTHLVLEKLYKLEQWIDDQVIKVPVLNEGIRGEMVNVHVKENTRPKLIRSRTEVSGVKMLLESHKFSDSNPDEDKAEVKATVEKSSNKVLNCMSGSFGNFVSSRPKLRRHQSTRFCAK